MSDDEQQDIFGAVPPDEPTGKYFRRRASKTERDSGIAVELRDYGPLKPGKAGHLVLRAFAANADRPLTAYDASFVACGEHHGMRREARRLYDRGYLEMRGTLPNTSPRGREHVQAWLITDPGLDECERLDEEAK